MIDFWAVLGLAIVDVPFRDKVLEVRKDLKELTDWVNKENNFQLSRFEVKEFADFMGHDVVKHCMEEMHKIWNPRICGPSLTYEAGYVHEKPSLEVIEAMRDLVTPKPEVSAAKLDPAEERAQREEQERKKEALKAFLAAWDEKKGTGHH